MEHFWSISRYHWIDIKTEYKQEKLLSFDKARNVSIEEGGYKEGEKYVLKVHRS